MASEAILEGSTSIKVADFSLSYTFKIEKILEKDYEKLNMEYVS
jgi:hypothetical protein